MRYQQLNSATFFAEVDSEEKARQWAWRGRFEGKDFVCPDCGEEGYWQHRADPEVRECELCRKRVRLRAGTMFRDSKVPILTWLRAIFFAMQDKRGVSALRLVRELGLKSYATAWGMLHKIREALRQRDDGYVLKGPVVELDCAHFGKQETGNQSELLIAIESKDWVDDKGRPKARAGFAKVAVAQETKADAQAFVDKAIAPGSLVNTDGGQAFRDLKGVDADYQVTDQDPEIIGRWLPWVHRFISNAKTWLLGTHHGIEAKYLARYMAEYAYRFNRRHDPDSLFHRALYACAIAKPVTLRTLSG
jgi:ISXO2-like transposase domain